MIFRFREFQSVVGTLLSPFPVIIFRKKIVTRSQILRQRYTKINFGWGSAPNPTEGSYDGPRDPLVGWGGGHPSHDSSPSTPTGLACLLEFSHAI